MATHEPIADEQIASLIPGCQRGEVAAVEELYALYAPRLYRYLLARTADPEAASDLVGETFVRLLKSIGRFRLDPRCPAAAFSAWLYRIAANLVTDYRRSHKHRADICLDDEDRWASGMPDPYHWVEQRESARRLGRALETLTDEQRLVILAKFGDDMSNLEVARQLGKTEGAIKSLQHRALRMLALVLNERDGQHER